MATMEAGPSTRRLRPIAPAPATATSSAGSDRSMRVRLPAAHVISASPTASGLISSHQNKRSSTRDSHPTKPVDILPTPSLGLNQSAQSPISAVSAPITYSKRKRSRSSSTTGLPSLPRPPAMEMDELPDQLKLASRESTPLSSASSVPPTSPSVRQTIRSNRKGKAKASGLSIAPRQPKPVSVKPERPQAEKRVLPARIRRAAGGGAEGIRDLEEMIVDWLERWGEPVESPPDSLILHLTTLPFSLIDPSPILAGQIPADPFLPITVTPNTTYATTHLEPAQPIIQMKERIEVPSWVYVRAGEDDQEEAKDELQTLNMKNGRGSLSPVKRLRHATAETPLEDTSDAYYIALHKKYEVFERRQRIREKEKLQFERYKLRSRIDLLRGMSKTSWSAVVSVVLSRSVLTGRTTTLLGEEGGEDLWAKGREKLGREGVDWLRDTLVKEGEELMRRFDQLLPPEHKKSRPADSRTPTPMASPSLSPPPVIPHRVAALRDPHTLPRKTATNPSNSSLPKRITLTLKSKSISTPTRVSSTLQAPGSEPISRGREKRKRVDRDQPEEAAERRSASVSASSRRMRSQTGEPAANGGETSASRERRASLRSQLPVKLGSSKDNQEADNTPAKTAMGSDKRLSRSSTRAALRADGLTNGQAVMRHDSLETLFSPGLAATATTTPYEISSKTRLHDPAEAFRTEVELSPEEARELREVEAVVL